MLILKRENNSLYSGSHWTSLKKIFNLLNYFQITFIIQYFFPLIYLISNMLRNL